MIGFWDFKVSGPPLLSFGVGQTRRTDPDERPRFSNWQTARGGAPDAPPIDRLARPVNDLAAARGVALARTTGYRSRCDPRSGESVLLRGDRPLCLRWGIRRCTWRPRPT